jgi:hypothetical protein
MSLPDVNTTLKRLRNRYKLMILNEDTFEEVVNFKLTRISVYVVLSSIFILLVGLTAALIVFTPLKYYLPGSSSTGGLKQMKEYRQLKMRTDSMERVLKYQDGYLKNIEKVLKGNVTKIDTTTLILPKVESATF